MQSVCGLLEPQSHGIYQANHRGTRLHGQVIEGSDLPGMHLAHGAIQYGCILAVHIHRLSADHSVAGHTAVRRSFIWFQIEIRGTCRNEGTDFNETVVIE